MNRQLQNIVLIVLNTSVFTATLFLLAIVPQLVSGGDYLFFKSSSYDRTFDQMTLNCILLILGFAIFTSRSYFNTKGLSPLHTTSAAFLSAVTAFIFLSFSLKYFLLVTSWVNSSSSIWSFAVYILMIIGLPVLQYIVSAIILVAHLNFQFVLFVIILFSILTINVFFWLAVGRDSTLLLTTEIPVNKYTNDSLIVYLQHDGLSWYMSTPNDYDTNTLSELKSELQRNIHATVILTDHEFGHFSSLTQSRSRSDLYISVFRNLPCYAIVSTDFISGDNSFGYLIEYVWLFGWRKLGTLRFWVA